MMSNAMADRIDGADLEIQQHTLTQGNVLSIVQITLLIINAPQNILYVSQLHTLFVFNKDKHNAQLEELWNIYFTIFINILLMPEQHASVFLLHFY